MQKHTLTFARLLAIGIEAHGLGKTDLAERAGIAPATLSRLLNGDRRPGARLRSWLLAEIGLTEPMAATLLRAQPTGCLPAWLAGERLVRRPAPLQPATAATTGERP